jgi:hypothetical protein
MKYKYDNLVLRSKYEPRNGNVNELSAPLGNLKDNEENALDDETISLHSDNEETDDNGLVAPLGNLKDNEENALDNETISLYSENKTWTTMNWPLPWAI